MMMKPAIALMFACCGVLTAQDVATLPLEDLVAKQDQELLDRQGKQIFTALDKLAAPYAESTVVIAAGNKVVASGLVVAPGKVLTKYSDLVRWRLPLVVVDHHQQVHDMRVLASSREHDVLLVEAAGLEARPIDLSNPAQVGEGSMVFLSGPRGGVADVGVCSVDQRSLREEDQPFIGIGEDLRWKGKGMRIVVAPYSPAEKGGLLNGDIIESINGKPTAGLLALRTLLNEVNPGDEIEIVVRRGEKTFKGRLAVGRRTRENAYPIRRLEEMNAMGNKMSSRRDRFPMVYQSDMTLLPECAGCPVIDLEGRLVGMALSRAGRMETYILPAWVVRELTDQTLAEVENKNIPVAEPVED